MALQLSDFRVGRTLAMEKGNDDETLEEYIRNTQQKYFEIISALEARIEALEAAANP